MPKFFTIEQIANQANFLVKDYQQVNRMRFNKLAAEFVMPDMQMDIIKEAKRLFVYVNKRTNTIEIPCDSIGVSSLSWVDDCGRIHPLYRNENLHNDIVDLGAKKDCACDCGNELCNMIKGYESVVTTEDAEMPDGSTQTFSLVNRKYYTSDGTYYESKQSPKREYANGEWVDTVVGTEEIELCKLELDANGCAKDCDANYRAVNSCGCSYYGNQNCRVHIPDSLEGFKLVQDYSIECGHWFASPCGGFRNIYNINDEGTRLVLPANFPFDKVLLRYYVDTPIKKMKVPFVARHAFIRGIMFYNIAFDEGRQQLAMLYETLYNNSKFALLQELNKYTRAELSMMMSPKVYIP